MSGPMNVSSSRVAHGHVLGEVDEALLELVVDVGVDDEALAGDAALPGRLERGHHRRVHRDVQVGVRGDHDAVLAAHLQGGVAAGDAAEFLVDLVADLGGAGEQDGADPLVLDDGVAGVAEALDHVEHAVGDARVDHHLGDDLAAPGRLLGGLPDDGVALDERDGHVPERDGDREVPRGDAADDAARLAPHVGVLGGDLRGDHVAVGVPCVAGRPLDHVGGLHHVRAALADLLAALAGDDLAEFVGSVARLVVDVPEHLGPVDVGHRTPLLEGLLRGGDRPLDVRGRPAVELAQRLTGRRILTDERLLALARRPLAVDVVPVGIRLLVAHGFGKYCTGDVKKPPVGRVKPRRPRAVSAGPSGRTATVRPRSVPAPPRSRLSR